MFETLTVQSHRGEYSVFFNDALSSDAGSLLKDEPHFIVDANVARLYAEPLRAVLSHPRTIVIEATEENKSLQNIIPVIERLVQNQVRRDHTIIAIGGGIIQDITCFIASTLLRGLQWHFVPTTLLAQADSCIGSKSSINLGATKNILGTFNPPRQITICARFLETLEKKDVRSGVGEMIKVHVIDGAASFDRLAAAYDRLFTDRQTLLEYIGASLRIKQRFIEQDEFDRGIRNIFNYGHSFGHAIESATRYAVPHGIAVTMGMDMANDVACRRGLLPKAHLQRMRGVLRKNYAGFQDVAVPFDDMMNALMKDKKNTSTALGLILPVGERAEIQRVKVPPDETFRSQCKEFLASLNDK